MPGLPTRMGPLPITSNISPTILREIGRICVAYSRIEWLLNKTLYDVLNVTPAEGRLAVRDPSPDQRLDLIEELLELKNIKVPIVNISELKAFLKEAKTKRDAVAHGIWLRERGDPTLYLRLINGTWTPPGTKGKTKRRVHLEGLEFNDDDAKLWTAMVQAVYDAVRVLHDAVINEMNRMVDAGTLPDRRPERSLPQRRTQGQTGETPSTPPESSAE
jgi:hypothetical protein